MSKKKNKKERNMSSTEIIDQNVILGQENSITSEATISASSVLIDNVPSNTEEIISSTINEGNGTIDEDAAIQEKLKEAEKAAAVAKENTVLKPIAPKQVIKATDDQDTKIKHMNSYLDIYIKHVKRTNLNKNEEKQTITYFGNIVNYLFRNPSVDLFHRIVLCFRENKKYVGPLRALKGINDMNVELQYRYSTAYSIIIKATENKLDNRIVSNEGTKMSINNDAFVAMLGKYVAQYM